VALRILIIDDHRDYRLWLANHVAAAQPEAAVVDYAPRRGHILPPDFDPARWDLMFLDHRLGEEDGLVWLRKFKSGTEFPPIVFLTPQGDQDAVLAALEAGADDYLPKEHVTHDHIVRVVREALRRGRRAAAPAAHIAASTPEEEFHLRGHRYLRCLGTGSTSAVYLMESKRRGELVVVKVFRQVPDASDAQALFQRFLREYEVISSIRHPNLVQIHDLGIADDLAYIAMEYFPGGDLGGPISRGMAPGEALDALAQIAAALHAVHAVGVLHRDIKPGNVMIREAGTLALIDFGLAKLRDAGTELTMKGEIFGTPYYMSPEQGHGAPVDERSDLYSLGVVLHEMLTGCKPYVAASPMAVIWKHRHAPVPELPARAARCQGLLERLMAKTPEERFGSAAEVLEALGRLTPAHAHAGAARP
jgi:DNA-binding response OmpR family regulator